VESATRSSSSASAGARVCCARRLPFLLRLGRTLVRPNRLPPPQQESGPGFYATAGPALRRVVMRCGPKNVFKRSVDALLIDIGINDVGFASWAAGIILQDSLLRAAASAMTPCFDGTARRAATRDLFTRLDSRYGLLRTVLDQYMLPDFGIDPSHVIVAVYPPALETRRVFSARRAMQD
jgi:hypothetical protein